MESLNSTGSPRSSTRSGIQAAKMAPPSQGKAQPVMGISQRVHSGPKKKKDLGTLGRLHSELKTNYSGLDLNCAFQGSRALH